MEKFHLAPYLWWRLVRDHIKGRVLLRIFEDKHRQLKNYFGPRTTNKYYFINLYKITIFYWADLFFSLHSNKTHALQIDTIQDYLWEHPIVDKFQKLLKPKLIFVFVNIFLAAHFPQIGHCKLLVIISQIRNKIRLAICGAMPQNK